LWRAVAPEGAGRPMDASQLAAGGRAMARGARNGGSSSESKRASRGKTGRGGETRRRNRFLPLKDEPAGYVLDAASLVLAHDFQDMIGVAEQLERSWPDKQPPATRERCYDLVREAKRRGMFAILPPTDFHQSQRLLREFCSKDVARRSIKVVDARHDALVHVATGAAELLRSLVRKHAARRAPSEVHLGLGVGNSVLHVIEALAGLLRTMSDCPRFVVHACIPSGLMKRTGQPGGAGQATTAMMAEQLRSAVGQAELIELDWAAWVPADAYKKTREEIASHRAFQQREAIDIIVVAPAPAQPHSVLCDFIRNDLPPSVGEVTRDELSAGAYVADVMCQPFSESGPLCLNRGMRALTLFELDELVAFAAQPNKDVVLLGGPCSSCGGTRTAALRPLIANEALRIWNHLVVDSKTAAELLDPHGVSPGACCSEADSPPAVPPPVHRPR